MNRTLATSIALILSPWVTQFAQAQSAVGADANSGGDGLQEIVVTAQRREESSQHAAIAISTLTGDAVENANVTRPGGLTLLAPSLQVQDDTGPYSIFYVRGVGNFAANGLSDPALMVNFDGVTVARSGTSGFFYDLERVEVLKGPQGTLYGRNATGGAINVISKRPVLGELTADASVQIGNYSASREEGALNLPVAGIAAVRIAAFHTQHLGYMSDGSDNQDDSGARLSFRLEPAQDLSINIVGDYFKQEGQASGGTITGEYNSFLPGPTFTPSDRYGLSSPQVTAFLASQPNFLNGRTFGPFDPSVPFEANRFYGIAATVDWRTPIGTLTAIPAYRDSHIDYASYASGVLLRELSHEKQTSFELRLASDNQSPLRYVAGVFYYDDPNSVPVFSVNQQSVLTFQAYNADTVSRAAFANLTYALVPQLRVSGGVRYTRDSKDFVGTLNANSRICPGGFFACPTAAVFPYTQESPSAPSPFGAFGPVLSPDGTFTTLTSLNENQSSTYSRVTWRGGIDWDITERNLLYAAVETGFKAGGFFFSSDNSVYKPESIRAYTVGSKNRFLDNRLQLNLEAFYWKYRDQQISHLGLDSLNQLIFPTENVGSDTIKGVEIELEAKPWRYTLLSGDIQYNHAQYDSFVYHTPNQNGGVNNGTGCANGAAPGTTYTVDCSGKQPPYAPRWTATLGVQQSILLPNAASLIGRGGVHYQSETLTGLEFLPVEYQPAYSIWNFDLMYAAKSDKYYVDGFIDNAFNKTALSFSFPVPLSGMMSGTLQPPRTFGVRVGVHF